MNEPRTMLCGRRFKIIREDPSLCSPAAYESGDDLVVTGKAFDAFEDVRRAGERAGLNKAAEACR